MWRRRRGHAPEGYRAAVAPAGPDAGRGGGGRRWRSWFGRGRRNAWRMDRAPVSQVAWANVPELTPRAAPSHVAPGLSPWPADERLGHDMPSVYCPRCGQENPDGARFCSYCGIPLARAAGDRVGESTSTLSLGGSELAEAEPEEPLADSAGTVEGLPQGTALLVVKRGPNAGSRFLLDSELTTAGRHPESDIFLDDVTVSRRHAEFYRHPRGFTVRDVGSLNGTYVNRERIEEADLNDGDEVQVGKFRLMFLAGRRSQADRGGGAQVGA
jgi:FHA domain/zinc-ribbon domain